jgi:oligoribonuclease NrnB/cAMP/cGMP phosphodiesterase (DHH superfamily)
MKKLITHKDVDGAVCAVFLKERYPDIEIFFCDYDTIDAAVESLLEDESDVFITDICPSRETCQKIDEKVKSGKKVQLIDHHDTKKRLLSKYDWAYFDEKACGALLTFKWMLDSYLFEGWLVSKIDSMRSLAHATDAWDRWLLKSENRQRGENLNSICQFIGLENFVSVFLENFEADKDDPFFIRLLGYMDTHKLRMNMSVIKKQLFDAQPYYDGFGQCFKIIFASNYISELGKMILEDPDHEDLHYIVFADPTNNKVSFRSREEEDVNVEQIAKRMGGGGHRASSGFTRNFCGKIERNLFHELNMIDG